MMDQLPLIIGDVALEFLARAQDDLGRGRRSGRAHVRDEIGDREVGFVAHAGDHGNRRRGDGPRDDFFVERPQVFERAAAARDDEHVRKFHAVEIAHGRGDLGCGSVSLHLHRDRAARARWRTGA